jgi:prepilin-type N-terminal cleavage/methylation domain-containing protein
MKKRPSFTLIELLVVIAVSSILFLSVWSALHFVTMFNDDAISSSSTSFMVRNIRAYIMSDDIKAELKDAYLNSEDINSFFHYNEEDETLSYKTTILSENIPYINVDFSVNSDNFLVCTITYKKNQRKSNLQSLTFIVTDIEV